MTHDTKIVALIPAHNEEASIEATILSLKNQTHPVTHIVVVADNCTDNTQIVASNAGATVLVTEGNTGKKAGALNQALASYLPSLPDDGLLLPMDADTILSDTFIERALTELEDPRVGGVGAVFYAKPGKGWLWLCQNLEWLRYAEQTDRTGKTFVMSGTASLVRKPAFESVYSRFGRYYDEDNITEDSRFSLDLNLCGWLLKSPVECSTTTETMPTITDLFRQRRRWYRGALANIMDTLKQGDWDWKVLLPYVRQQVMILLGVTLLWTLIGMTVAVLVMGTLGAPQPFWLAVGGVFLIERVVSVWDAPWRHRLFAGCLIPELGYALVLQVSYVAALWQTLTGSTGTWHHLENRKEDDHVFA